jgi:hypothetical protein
MNFIPDKLEVTLLTFPSLLLLDLISLKDSLNRLNEDHRFYLFEFVNRMLLEADQSQQTLIHNAYKMIYVYCEICPLMYLIDDFNIKNIPLMLDAIKSLCQICSEHANHPLSLDVAISQVARELAIDLPKTEKRKSSELRCLNGIYTHLLSLGSTYRGKMVWSKEEFLAKIPEFDSEYENWLDVCKQVDSRFLSEDESETRKVKPFKAYHSWRMRFHKDLDEAEFQNLLLCHNLMVILVALTNDKETICVELATFLQGKVFSSGGDNGPGNIRRKYLHKRLMAMKHQELELMQSPLGKHLRAPLTCAIVEDFPLEVQSRKLRRSYTYPPPLQAEIANVHKVFAFDHSIQQKFSASSNLIKGCAIPNLEECCSECRPQDGYSEAYEHDHDVLNLIPLCEKCDEFFGCLCSPI